MEFERKAILKIRNLEEEDDLVRSSKDAKVILEGLKEIQILLWNSFSSNSFLISLFNYEFLDFNQFLHNDFILETCFFDNHLFPEKALLPFDEESPVRYLSFFQDWINEKKFNHEKNRTFLNQMSTTTRERDMECRCMDCVSFYRSHLRKLLLEDCLEIIETASGHMEENLEKGMSYISNIYRVMNRDVERKILETGQGLKRASLKKIESRMKTKIKEKFSPDSTLSQRYIKTLSPFFEEILNSKNIKLDIITEDEYDRFFNLLSSDLWKGERFLRKEFDKFVGSIIRLKRRDISSKILREYLGEFWTHASARKIKRKIIYHRGPTNSGKTYHAINALCKAESGCYLAPLRLLAVELFDTMNAKGTPTSLLTGEEVISIPKATHYSSTIEMAKLQHTFDCCVIDEIQMIADDQRGWAWTRALVNLNVRELHLCGDESALELVKRIVELCDDELEIKEYERMTHLTVQEEAITVKQLEKHDAVIVFSRRSALKFKQNLEKFGLKVSIVYGRLGPEVRREQARKFDQNETDIMVSTDAIAMGMNLPIKRIVFSTLSKFIDSEEYPITQSEIKQIAGRAGRYQRFSTGYVTCLSGIENGIKKIKDALLIKLKQKTKSMVGPDFEIFSQVNVALKENGLSQLSLSEFLRLFNTINFRKPFYCVDLKEMISVAEMVEEVDRKNSLSDEEIFGFACAPVNLGLVQHVHYFVRIVGQYVAGTSIKNIYIDYQSDDIDFLETSIKCVELYQWLARHFNGKYFEFDQTELLENKSKAIEKLNTLLSDIIVLSCISCGVKLPRDFNFSICENCFKKRRFPRMTKKKRPFSRKREKSSKKRGRERKTRFFRKVVK